MDAAPAGERHGRKEMVMKVKANVKAGGVTFTD